MYREFFQNNITSFSESSPTGVMLFHLQTLFEPAHKGVSSFFSFSLGPHKLKLQRPMDHDICFAFYHQYFKNLSKTEYLTGETLNPVSIWKLQMWMLGTSEEQKLNRVPENIGSQYH